MVYHPDIHQRRSMRLPRYDYTGAGAYFITICAWRRECLFGEALADGVRLNGFGEIVCQEWKRTDRLRENVRIDEFVVMPNHLHGILFLHDDDDVGATGRVALPPSGPASGSIGAIIGQFKSAATKRINRVRPIPGAPVWQRNYFERVIRNERELAAVRQYIVDNPAKWDLDENHPSRNIPPPR